MEQGQLFLWPDLEGGVALATEEGRGIRDPVVFFLKLSLAF